VLRDGRPAGPGESGEVVVTAPHMFAMPLIRYRLGDLVTVEKVAGTGETVSTLRSIRGRTMELFTLPDGEQFHPYILNGIVEDSGLPVRRFQVIQEKRDRFLMRLIFLDGSRPRLDGFQKRISAALGPGIRIRTEVVETLLPKAGSKFQTYIPVEQWASWSD